MIVETITSPEDVKKLDRRELDTLCQELRELLIEKVSQTGGHLASNLGAVELTVAIHRVFDTAEDRLVFDVGHQCYVHKLLTGRRDRFDTLRQFGGIAGFPKPEESIHDAFIAGHASNSISVALGLARARTRLGQSHNVLALIGDGALTGGLSYEGLNDAGASGEPLIVILNDNGMSIDPNVGSLSSYLARIRTRASYYTFKKLYHAVMKKLPGGQRLYRFNHAIKTAVKKCFYPCTMFEDMGFTYLGPVDGHNIGRLSNTLSWARDLHCPVIVHVRTQKGRGYAPAERDPDRYHGVAPFDPSIGVESSKKLDFSAVFGETLLSLAHEERRVCAVCAAMAEGTGLADFARQLPDRFFDVGIAEGHAVALAGGLAKGGMIPVFAVYSTFLQRGFDMICHDVALQNLHVVFAVDRAGLVGADGATHHGVQDIAFLSTIPNLTILAPASFQELRDMLRQAVLYTDGPVAVRYPRGGQGRYREGWNARDITLLQRGQDVTLLSYGPLVEEAMTAAEMLTGEGVSVELIKLNTLAPLMSEQVYYSVQKTGRLVVVEDCFTAGSIGQQMVADMEEHWAMSAQVRLLNLGDQFIAQGSVPELRHSVGIDARGIVKAVREVMRRG